MGAHILLVEDDRRIRTSLRLVLENEGNSVDEAESAEAALEILGRRPAAVAILDLMLPGID
ncbi:MAG: response regulator, partial [Actinomycetota bacterium]|nr:response regulator [Actinomycetota bacterium]